MATYVGFAAIREEVAWRNISTKPHVSRVEEAKGQTFEKVEPVIFSSEAKVLSREIPAPPERI
jgi:hypothetical protein